MTDGTLGRGRTLAAPQFAGDDGSVDPAVRDLLASAHARGVSLHAVARGLRGHRLFTGVVAVLDSLGADGEEKDSHMAVVSMVNATGQRGLLAFSGVAPMTAWNPEARPVPAYARDIARSALADDAVAVVVDVVGPITVRFTGRLLRVLADVVDVRAITERVHTVLGPLARPGAAMRVVDVRAVGSGPAGALADLDVAGALAGVDVAGVDVAVLLSGFDVEAAAAVLGADDDVADLAAGGLAVVPADAPAD